MKKMEKKCFKCQNWFEYHSKDIISNSWGRYLVCPICKEHIYSFKEKKE